MTASCGDSGVHCPHEGGAMRSKRAMGMCLSVGPVCRGHAAGEREGAGAASYRRSGPPTLLEEPREPWGCARAN